MLIFERNQLWLYIDTFDHCNRPFSTLLADFVISRSILNMDVFPFFLHYLVLSTFRFDYVLV